MTLENLKLFQPDSSTSSKNEAPTPAIVCASPLLIRHMAADRNGTIQLQKELYQWMNGERDLYQCPIVYSDATHKISHAIENQICLCQKRHKILNRHKYLWCNLEKNSFYGWLVTYCLSCEVQTCAWTVNENLDDYPMMCNITDWYSTCYCDQGYNDTPTKRCTE